ncbi:MAG: MBL fold metallo-hydrolase [Deltaproteobacteria bacterium HGW-Deltaproteobacteria-14]|jgi:glyoxylase-like metal-dependent hydrolase (beta-lactamase superfamily II)|nr:MAG: MBL fold metallo-hydrolase [Deltaproteobacteria bacterium HGW-Deltaproteobacteria-14]
MRPRPIISLALGLLLPLALVGCGSASSRDTPAAHTRLSAPLQHIVKTIGDVRLHTFVAPPEVFGVTAHIIETSESLVVIDTQLLEHHAKQLRAYADGLHKPIVRVIVSHGHPDHYFGVAQFADLPTFALPKSLHDMGWRHKGHWRNHRRMEGDQIAERIVLPRSELVEPELEVDGVVLRFDAVEACEDNMQLVVRLPAQRAIIVQDIVYTGYHPFFLTADFAHWREVLEALAADPGYDYVMGGHGAPGGVETFAWMRAYLDRAETVLGSSKSPSDAVRGMMAAYPDLSGGDVMLSILEGFSP